MGAIECLGEGNGKGFNKMGMMMDVGGGGGEKGDGFGTNCVPTKISRGSPTTGSMKPLQRFSLLAALHFFQIVSP